MKFEEISAPSISLRIKPKLTKEKLKDCDILAIKFGELYGEFELYFPNDKINIIPLSLADVNELSRLLSSGRAILASITDIAPDGSAALNVVYFSGEQIEMGDIEIGIDETIQARLGKNTLDDAAEFLLRESIIKHGNKTYFVIVAGAASDAYLKSEDSPSEDGFNDSLCKEDNSGIVFRNFAILGKDIRFSLSEKDKGDGEYIYFASKIRRSANIRRDPAARLACGNLRFIDWTRTGKQSVIAKRQLDKLISENDSYLRKWDEFGDIEGELLLERARKVGIIPFCIKNDDRDGYVTLQCVNLSAIQKEMLNEKIELDAVFEDEIPTFLNDQNMKFKEYALEFSSDNEYEDYLGERNRNKTSKEKKNANNKKDDTIDRNINNEIISNYDFNSATGEIRYKTIQSPKGKWLIYSITGEIAQIKRRMIARRYIQTGRAANPNLGILIEENGQIPPTIQPPKLKIMTSFVKNKLGKNFTLAQEKAIDIALNTPDIALIQGPPGTGKTTVIAAIVERLNEESDKRKNISGNVLLSGFQHDAVENMIDRLSINGLPVPKLGQRPGELEGSNLTRFEEELSIWRQTIVDKLKKKNPQLSESVEEQNVRNLCIQYLHSPTYGSAIALLETVLKLSPITIGEDLRNRLKIELNTLKTSHTDNKNPKLLITRGIRVTEVAFMDDGPERAGDALYALKDDLQADEKELLIRAEKGECNSEILRGLKILKGRLMNFYTPAPEFQMPKPRDTIISLCEEAIECIRTNGTSMRDKKSAALAEFLTELECDPTGVLDSIKDYCFAFAETCQQSVNKNMQRMKGVRTGTDSKMEFDYVIVDEAARVSPRDLMIPMAMGKRIILVGDHRQLPQLIDEKVAAIMESKSFERAGGVSDEDNTGNEENEWIKKSMFEYLFTERLQKLQESDGIVRTVTLDRQYRTNKLLGDFISQNFYERFNPNEKFESGRDDKDFEHDLPGTKGKFAAWLDVPRELGGISYSGTSLFRHAEVDCICKKLKDWIEHDNKRTNDPKKRFSFGVISFYKKQAEEIEKRLGKKFIDTVGEKRLRIGTVDSFQGMEFDVVFLSLVRTGKKSFGFLELYNRLNVGMSRQKRLLVVVGDAKHYDTDTARARVPALYEFLKLCKEKGVVL